MRSLEAQLQLLLFAALLYTSGSGGLRYDHGPRLAPSLQDIVNTAHEPLQVNTTEQVYRPGTCCWDDVPSLAPTVVLRPSHPDAVPDPTWAETLRTATWRALGEGSGRSPAWQELAVAPFPKSTSRTPPSAEREVVLLARGVLIRESDDRLRFTEECVCDKSAETAGVLATWGVRRVRHSGPNQFHRPYYELQFSASALLPTLPRPATVFPPGKHSAPVAKGIVFNLTGTRKIVLPPDSEQSTRLPNDSVKNTTDPDITSPKTSTSTEPPTTSTTVVLETITAENTKPVTTVPVNSTPVSIETANPFKVPDPTIVAFEAITSAKLTPSPEDSSKPDLTVLSSLPSPPTWPSTSLKTTSTLPPPTTQETLTSTVTSPSSSLTDTTSATSTEMSTPTRFASPFRLSLLTTSTLGRLLDLTTTSPTTFRPPWRPRIRPRSKVSIVETRTTYKVSAVRKPKRP